MTPYLNRGGDSGVLAYEIKERAILVKFPGMIYTYDYSHPGTAHVERMKQLAIQGEGLNEYISRHIQDNYASKRSA
jgi:hypothetical protein